MYYILGISFFCLIESSVHADADGSGSYGHVNKRARRFADESDEDREQEDNYLTCGKNDLSFEDLWGERSLDEEISMRCPGESWGMLNSHILARIFHFLRTDMKSLILSAATCKHWRAAVQSYKNICKQVDLSYLGSSCTDSIFQSIMVGFFCQIFLLDFVLRSYSDSHFNLQSDYDKNNISSMTLSKCSNISATALEEILQSFTGITSIDIRGCSQFRELILLFQNVKWIKSRSSQNIKNLDESYSKTRSLKWITDKSFPSSRSSKDAISDRDDLGNSKDPGVHTFRQGYYKRTRVPDALKSSSALTRHAQLRQLLRKKSVTDYRKMEEFIGIRLKEIMKGNSFEFFVPRVMLN